MRRYFTFVSFVALAATVTAASMDITSKSVLGVLPVTVPANRTTVILSVPWVEEGGRTNAISVTNFVLTSGLTAKAGVARGDQLKWWNAAANRYDVWYLHSGSPNYWAAAETTVGSSIVESTDPSVPCPKQGDAVLLMFQTAPTVAKTIYLVGQVGTNDTVSTTVPGKVGDKDTMTLVAPPSVAQVNLNDSSAVTGWNVSCTNDQIIVDVVNGTQIKYTYKNDKWNSPYGVGATPSIGRGKGFWYVRGDATPLTITWKNPAKRAE